MDKTKLIIALVVLVVIFGIALYLENYFTDPRLFLNNLYKSKKSAIIMDVSASPKQQITTAIMQCGINFISGGFYAKTGQELEVYACDRGGCIKTHIDPNQEQILNSTNYNETMPFDQVLAQIKNMPYIYIRYGAEQKFISHPNYLEAIINAFTFFVSGQKTNPNYLEVIINEQSDPKNCQLNLRIEQEQTV